MFSLFECLIIVYAWDHYPWYLDIWVRYAWYLVVWVHYASYLDLRLLL